MSRDVSRRAGAPVECRPLISIVTVCFNAESLIERTIKSVFEQRFDDLEYIIIDGGSRDGTVEIIERYSSQVDFFLSEADSGIYNAMNKAILVARGRWINFLNAGDVFTSREVLSRMARELGGSGDVLFGDRNYVKNGERVLQTAKPIDTIFEKMPFGHQSAFVSTEVLKRNMFNETYKFAADYDLFFRLYIGNCVFKHVDIVVCDFLSGGQSETGIRPYFEAVKILLDNTSEKSVLQQNVYLGAFVTRFEKWIEETYEGGLPPGRNKREPSVPSSGGSIANGKGRKGPDVKMCLRRLISRFQLRAVLNFLSSLIFMARK